MRQKQQWCLQKNKSREKTAFLLGGILSRLSITNGGPIGSSIVSGSIRSGGGGIIAFILHFVVLFLLIVIFVTLRARLSNGST